MKRAMFLVCPLIIIVLVVIGLISHTTTDAQDARSVLEIKGIRGPDLVDGVSIAAGGELRTVLLGTTPIDPPQFRETIVFHLSGGTSAIENINVRILFGTDKDALILLGSTLVDFTQGKTKAELEHLVPEGFGRTGVFIKVPILSEMLYDVILENVGDADTPPLYLTTWYVR